MLRETINISSKYVASVYSRKPFSRNNCHKCSWCPKNAWKVILIMPNGHSHVETLVPVPDVAKCGYLPPFFLPETDTVGRESAFPEFFVTSIWTLKLKVQNPCSKFQGSAPFRRHKKSTFQSSFQSSCQSLFQNLTWTLTFTLEQTLEWTLERTFFMSSKLRLILVCLFVLAL